MRRRYSTRIRTIRPYAPSHAAMLELFSVSRVYIGLSKSDGISTALLEAMATGCFPIQTAPSCADEWFVHGQTGMIVDWNADGISSAITRALSDDELIDRAAGLDSETIEVRGSIEWIRMASRTYYGLQ